MDPRDKNVEFWMGDVERMMVASVRHVLLKSIQVYPETPRCEWVLEHPGQCVLNGSQVHYTSEVETAMKEHGDKGIVEYAEKL